MYKKYEINNSFRSLRSSEHIASPQLILPVSVIFPLTGRFKLRSPLAKTYLKRSELGRGGPLD